jgi:ABC-2 type transport system ATP-binding protein
MNAALPIEVLTGALAIQVAEMRVPSNDFDIHLTNWHVERGSRVALIGANGSGKTTVMDALLGLRKTTRREGNMLGESLDDWLRKTCLRKRCGVLLQNASLPTEMYVSEVVTLHRELYGRSTHAVLEALGIAPLARKRYSSLSRGERQRVDLMMALAHEPEIVFLDEPLTGLDKQYARALCDTIERLKSSTVVMACHSAEELQLCDRVAWIQRGSIRAWDSPQLLREQLVGDHRLKVNFVDAGDVPGFAQRVTRECGAPRFTQSDGTHQLTVFGGESLSQLARDLVDDKRVDGIEFGRTGYTDLLYRCALGDPNV